MSVYSLALMRVEANTNCQVVNPQDADFDRERYRLFAQLREAATICGECVGTDDCHYLSCSTWDFLTRARANRG